MQLAASRNWIIFSTGVLGAVVATALMVPKAPPTAAGSEPPKSSGSGASLTPTILRQTRETERRARATLADGSIVTAWMTNSPESIPALQAAIAAAATIKSNVDLRFRLTRELLWNNQNDEALHTLAGVRELVESPSSPIKRERAAEILALARELTAICHLRIAEQDNCVCSHNSDSCLFPIRGGGVHSKKAGAHAAIKTLSEILGANPNDLGARWLINLLYMTLEEYPQGVPAEWLIPPRVFASDSDIGQFKNVATQQGVDVFGHAGGCILEDIDGDGRLDLMTSSRSLEETVRYFWNRGNKSFEERTEKAGLSGQVGGTNLSHADYDNDGHPDVLVLRGGWLGGEAYPHSLLRNKGDGTFEEVTREVGMRVSHSGTVGIWGDFDNDGWVDLFIGHEEDRLGTHRPFLYHNEKGLSFTEIGGACGLDDLGSVKGAAWGDYDNDGWMDLYLSRSGQTNVLLRNEGAATSGGQAGGKKGWKFRDVTDRARVAAPFFSYATWFFDFDNDGWSDIFVAGFKPTSIHDLAAMYLGQPHTSEVPRLYRNNRDGTFADVTHEKRLDRVVFVMGANFGDLDNDGFPDIYLGTGGHDLSLLVPNRMFLNIEGKSFDDVTTSARVGHVQKGNAVAFGDIDGDGDQDLYAVMGGRYSGDGFRSCLFENPGHGNHWITLRLRGTRTNRSGIGARIRLVLTTARGPREVHACVGTGGSFGASSLQQEIGLGSADTIQSLEITWPVSGKTQVLRDVKVDQVLEIQEE